MAPVTLEVILSELKEFRSSVDRRFEALHKEMDSRFNSLNIELDSRFVAINRELGEIKQEVRTIRNQTALNSEEITSLSMRMSKTPSA